jgi:hypothetical protein
MSQEFEYDVALSFAGEQREYVERVASNLRSGGVRVFYDSYEKADLWGKDLYEHLDYVYQRAARFCVVFASVDYAMKMWTSHERRSAQARAIEEKVEYILPARFDDTEIPGIRKTVGHIDLTQVSADELSQLIVEKLGPRSRSNYFPADPIRLFEMLEVEGTVAEDWTVRIGRSFYLALRRMTEAERLLLFEVFAEGCESNLPENVHVSLDLIRRVTGTPPVEVRQMLKGLSSLGIEATTYSSSDHEEDDMVKVVWDDRTVLTDEDEDDFAQIHSTEVARAVLLGAAEDFCTECARAALKDLNFSALAEPLPLDE